MRNSELTRGKQRLLWEEKYSPVISPDNVFIVNKYTGSAERIYVTVNALYPGDVVYAYKLLADGSYSKLASKTCQSAADSATVSFAKPAGISDQSCG